MTNGKKANLIASVLLTLWDYMDLIDNREENGNQWQRVIAEKLEQILTEGRY